MYEELFNYFKSLGFSDNDIKKFMKKSSVRDVNFVRSKVQELRRFFNTNLKQIKTMIMSYPNIIKLSVRDGENSIQNKIRNLADIFEVDESRMTNLVMVNSFMLRFGTNDVARDKLLKTIESYRKIFDLEDISTAKQVILRECNILYCDVDSDEVTSAKNKIRDYEEILGLTHDEAQRMIISRPVLLNFDTRTDSKTSVKGKIRALMDIFDKSYDEICYMIRQNPVILTKDMVNVSATSIKGKIEAFSSILGVDTDTIRKKLFSYTPVLSYDTFSGSKTSMTSKLEYFQQLFRISFEEAKNMVFSYPNILSYGIGSEKNSSLEGKVESLRQFMTDNEIKDIVISRARILSTPAKAFKIRYMLAEIMDMKKDFLVRGYMLNEKKIWARYKYLTDNNLEYKVVYREKQMFDKRYDVNSDDLMTEYPMTKDSIDEIEKLYLEKTGKSVKLDDSERKYLGFER